MRSTFDIKRFHGLHGETDQFGMQTKRLDEKGSETIHIKRTVNGACDNLSEKNPPPFIIYGEPQSGKTEMMICLTAKLLDLGYEFIVVLLNDNVELLQQNLGRFRESGLSPSPDNFSEILEPDHKIKGIKHVVFCKKNPYDLEKLIDKIDVIGKIVVIDDEADYATPNAKINASKKTRINELIEKLLGKHGIYIGVTATPARLDLNNTFGNIAARWIDFGTHKQYTGQSEFFPTDKNIQYRLKTLGDSGDNRSYITDALFNFLAATAYLNSHKRPGNYSMLVHTSGRVEDHQRDKTVIAKVFEHLADENSPQYDNYVEQLYGKVKDRYSKNDYPEIDDNQLEQLVIYILLNIPRHKIIVLNSKKDISVSGQDATNPKSLFTIVIGGNIVSRGVTLKNLLSMYFTRDVRHKIQQDTYIQRARMFGVRGNYLKEFELTIPDKLYNDWHRCFVYHKLSLDGARAGNAPIWITDRRVSAVAASSIDKINIYNTKTGELSFEVFTENLTEALEVCSDPGISNNEKLRRLKQLLPESAFPDHLIRFTATFAENRDSVAVYPAAEVSAFTPDPARNDDIPNIVRARGFWGEFKRDRTQFAIHHFKIFHYQKHKGKLFYKYNSDSIDSLRFLLRR